MPELTDDDIPDEFPKTYDEMTADLNRKKYEARAKEDNDKYNAERNRKRRESTKRKKEIAEKMASDPDFKPDEDQGIKQGGKPTEKERTEDWDIQLRILEKRTRGNPTDADGDIDFAYRNMALPNVTPKMAPSISGWSWYIYARTEPNKFLEICAKREDAKAKLAGTITNQRMEDDKRQQFAVIDRLEKSLKINVDSVVRELMEKFPDDVLEVCYSFEAKWAEFSESKRKGSNHGGIS